MIKPLMQIPPTIKVEGYNDKLIIRLNELFEFEYIFKTSQLTICIPAPKGNAVSRMIYDSFTLTQEEHESVLIFITKYFESNQKEMIKEIIDGKSEVLIRPAI